MGFEKGNNANPLGRPRGSGIKSLRKAVQVLVELGRHPIEELVKIADDPDTKVAMRREIWAQIQSFCEAPQTIPTNILPQTPEDSVEAAAQVMAYLDSVSKPLEPIVPDKPSA